jgi:hypothetical protein
LVVAVPVSADEVTSKGIELRGKVKRLTSSGVTLESGCCEGAILMRWKDVEKVTTDGAIYVQYGEDEEVVAPVRGKSGGAILVGDKEIDVTTIYAGTPVGPDGPTWKQRLRGHWRFWHGNFDLGFNYQQSTIDTSGLLIGFETTRSKAPTRLILGASYRYFSAKKQGQPSTTLEDETKALIRGEYDFTERLYGFASDDVKHDSVERLKIRSVPKAGAGYTIYREYLDEERQNFVNVEAGGGWVYQRFVGGSEDNYFAVVLGLVAGYTLPYDSRLDGRFDYLPAIDDWANRYLLRQTASLSVPMFDPLSVKLSLVDEYNSKPARDAEPNSLYLTLGLSAGW